MISSFLRTQSSMLLESKVLLFVWLRSIPLSFKARYRHEEHSCSSKPKKLDSWSISLVSTISAICNEERNSFMSARVMKTEQTVDEETTRPTYSIVAPVFNEEETVPHFYQRIVGVMEQLGESFEVVLVNDGSQDGSYAVMKQLHQQDPRVRVVDFSRNFGHQIAISAGLDHARGDAVVIID